MSTPEQLDVIRRLYESQEKHAYFLLAAVGACIGFSITQSNQAIISCQQIPLALAILMWGISFYCGCRYIQEKQSVMHFNFKYLVAENTKNPAPGLESARVDIEKLVALEGVNSTGVKARRYRLAQFYLFIAAVAFYITWHIIKMWARTLFT